MAVYLSLSLSQGTPNTTTRTTTVTATVKVHYSGGSYNGNSPSGTLTIDGQSFSFTCNFNYAGIGQGAASTGSGSVTACTQTVTVSYGSSSTKTVSASASFASGTASGTVTASDSITLTSIGSSGGSSGDGDDGGEEWEEGGDSGSGGVVNQGNATIVGAAFFYTEGETLKYYNNTTCSIDNYRPTVYVLKFKTPTFVGVSQSLDVNLSAAGTDSNTGVCYALCESDANHDMYFKANTTVDDPYQIATGSLSKAEWESMPFSIETTELESGKNYYLVFWIPYGSGYNDFASAGLPTSHSINLNYTDVIPTSTSGVAYVDGGSEFVKYEVYIDTGSEFVRYEVYVDNGTGWDLGT